jgi:hypothetical protein
VSAIQQSQLWLNGAKQKTQSNPLSAAAPQGHIFVSRFAAARMRPIVEGVVPFHKLRHKAPFVFGELYKRMLATLFFPAVLL